ncbi:hypothetical protein CBL_01796 [Carabus blaptoides fortunei]
MGVDTGTGYPPNSKLEAQFLSISGVRTIISALGDFQDSRTVHAGMKISNMLTHHLEDNSIKYPLCCIALVVKVALSVCVGGSSELREDEPDQDATASAKRAYISRQGKAHAKIAPAICDEQQMHIRSLTSPKNVWEELQRLYAPKDSKFRTVQLRRKLYSLKMADCDSIENYLGEINRTVADLSSIGDTIEDGDLAMTILCGLSDDWDTVVSALCNLPEGDFKSATIKRRLLAEDARRRENIDSKSAMFLKGTKTSPKPNNQKSGKTVEMTSNNKKPEQTKKQTAQKGKIEHITLADGRTTATTGKGTVKVKIKNNPAILHEFEAKNTLLVPEIDHGILSVKQLTENDKKVVFHKEGCFIYDKDDQLLIKAEQKGRLYTINTEPSVINSSMLNSLKHKDTKMEPLELWHRRMMHIRFRAVPKTKRDDVERIQEMED